MKLKKDDVLVVVDANATHLYEYGAVVLVTENYISDNDSWIRTVGLINSGEESEQVLEQHEVFKVGEL